MQVSGILYSYTTIRVPTNIVLIVNDNGTYSNTRISKDMIFEESVVFDKFIDNSPTDVEFAALPHIIENMNDGLQEKVKIRIRYTDQDGNEQEHVPESPPVEILDSEPIRRNISPHLEIYSPQDYKDMHPDNEDSIVDPLPTVLPDTSEYAVYWSKITKEPSAVPILDIGTFNHHEFMARCMMTVTSAAPRNFEEARIQPAWHPAINEEIGNFIDNTCF